MPDKIFVGDAVMIWGGMHHLRHGVVEPWDLHHFSVPGFALVRFRTRRGELMKKPSMSGEADCDVIRIDRMVVFLPGSSS